MKAKYLNLPNNLPTTHRDLQNAENKKIASLQEAKDQRKDPISPTITDQEILDQSRPNYDQSRPLDGQTAKLDGQKAVQKPLASHKNLDGQKYIDSEFLSRQERTKLTVRLPKHKINKYKKYAFESKLALQDLIELALDKLLDGQTFLDGKQNLDGQLSRPNYDRSDHDLDIDIDDRSLDGQKLNEALNFYKEWTNNKLTHKDEISYYSIAHIDLLDIKIGILQAVKNSTTPVRMFSYCVKTILNNSKGRKPRYKYDKNQLLKDLIYEIEKREENKQA